MAPLALFGALLVFGAAHGRPQGDDDFIASLLGPGGGDNATDDKFIESLLGDAATTSAPCTDLTGLDDAGFLDALTGGCGGGAQPKTTPAVPCERGRHLCTPYFRCDEADIVSDRLGEFNVRIGKQQFEQDFDFITHSECRRFGDVCCARPKPDDGGGPPTDEPYAPQCGRRNSFGVGARIVGFNESESQFGEFPWMAAVLRVEQVGGEERNFFECGGSLIHPQVVLTAAHCVRGQEGAHLRVRLGEWDTQHESELFGHADIDVARVAAHEDFGPRRLNDDIALLFLERPAELREHIDTLCLPDPAVDYGRADCVATGWGKDSFQTGQFQTVLKRIELPLVPHGPCQAALRDTHLRRYFALDRSFTCAGGAGGQDTCTGDGGSPLACRHPTQPDRYVQLGIVSWGIGCGLEGVPGVYADVSQKVDWIRRQLPQ